MGEREERVGKNEALFREVNERIAEITTYEGDVEFLCECGDPTCTKPITMRLPEYEGVRAYEKRFVVVSGHEIPDVERVIDRTTRYYVVEKLPGVPTEIGATGDEPGP